MSRVRRVVVRSTAVVMVVASVAFAWVTRNEAHKMVTNPRATRKVATVSPADRGLKYENADVTTSDGFKLHGWFVPENSNAATIMIVHGYKDSRASVLGIAEVLHRHGYQVLVASLRGHDMNDGEMVSFGFHEMKDLEAWRVYLHERSGVDADRLGLFGVSMGGTIGLGFAAGHPDFRAIVADSAFASVSDTAATSIRFFTGLPPFPFAPAMIFWMEREIGGSASDLDATRWVPKIAPRPILFMQGGADRVVSATSGQVLFAAASEPKELWFEPTVGHAQFLKTMPEQFEQRVVQFLDRYFKTTLRPAQPSKY